MKFSFYTAKKKHPKISFGPNPLIKQIITYVRHRSSHMLIRFYCHVSSEQPAINYLHRVFVTLRLIFPYPAIFKHVSVPSLRGPQGQIHSKHTCFSLLPFFFTLSSPSCFLLSRFPTPFSSTGVPSCPGTGPEAARALRRPARGLVKV